MVVVVNNLCGCAVAHSNVTDLYFSVQHSADNAEVHTGCNHSRLVCFILADQDDLGMEHTIAVNIIFKVVLIRFLLIIGLDETMPVNNKQADEIGRASCRERA